MHTRACIRILAFSCDFIPRLIMKIYEPEHIIYFNRYCQKLHQFKFPPMVYEDVYVNTLINAAYYQTVTPVPTTSQL